MSRYRQQDLRFIRRSEVRFGWAVPLGSFVHGHDEKERQWYRKRLVRHIFESEEFKLTALNGALHVELASAEHRNIYPDATPKQLHTAGITKKALRELGHDVPVGKW